MNERHPHEGLERSVAIPDERLPGRVRVGPDQGDQLLAFVDQSEAAEAVAVLEELAERNSFYARRSARLPTIGETKASEALAAVSAMRTNQESTSPARSA